MPIISFFPFSLVLYVPFLVLTIGSPNSVSKLLLLALSPLFWDILIWLAFVAFLCGGFPFLVPSLPSILAFLPVPDVFTSSGVFGVCGLCFAIRASIWSFSNANLLASFSFISCSICNHLAFSSASLLSSVSFDCLLVSVALFLSCNVFLPLRFDSSIGLYIFNVC